jgi:hypothetical protein
VCSALRYFQIKAAPGTFLKCVPTEPWNNTFFCVIIQICVLISDTWLHGKGHMIQSTVYRTIFRYRPSRNFLTRWRVSGAALGAALGREARAGGGKPRARRSRVGAGERGGELGAKGVARVVPDRLPVKRQPLRAD